MRFLARIDHERTRAGGQVAWAHATTPQTGYVASNLCAHCNSDLGAWYNSAYVGFTRYIAGASLRPGITLNIPTVRYPLRIVKTAIQCFASSLGRPFVDHQPWIRQFLLNKESQALPSVPRLFVFGVATQGVGRQTGAIGISDERLRRPTVLAEFAFWPVGFVLCYEDLRLEKSVPVASISHWANYGYYDEAGISLDLPINDISTPYPLDFRTPQQVADQSPSGPLPPWFVPRT
jgi:hypothetical protein